MRKASDERIMKEIFHLLEFYQECGKERLSLSAFANCFPVPDVVYSGYKDGTGDENPSAQNGTAQNGKVKRLQTTNQQKNRKEKLS